MILHGCGRTWNALLTRYCLDCQANSNPRPSPRFRTTSFPDDNQAGLAPPKIRPPGTGRCRDALTLAARHELHLVEVPVSTSGADSSAGACARPHPSAAQLLAAKNTRPIKSLDDLAADILVPTRNWRNSWPSAHRAPPRPCLTARGAVAHPLLDTVSSSLHRGKLTGPLSTRLIGREPPANIRFCRIESLAGMHTYTPVGILACRSVEVPRDCGAALPCAYKPALPIQCR